ncbi:iron complex outermembrane recepter protein [Methylophilus rhizosphaerae]|uniref:Iron complex outermembrane recepter protein n=1 Tax=Methylophilus rhizosphaerae TaxID=492660 RepID=A0A1G9CQL2_9PROT|nr:TonB-dependent receptor [Methylophilus rhizosphaerae]SDK53952.1 iron complex outermembrane recepter protein [Methylophilus rhizosphaerae]
MTARFSSQPSAQARLRHLSIAALLSISINVYAASSNLDIAAQSLDQAILTLGKQSGENIAFPSDLASKFNAPAIKGNYSVEQALEKLLKGTGLVTQKTSAGYSVVKAPEEKSQTLPEVEITDAKENSKNLPEPYAGGQVARGGKVGVLGDRDFMDTPFNMTTYTSTMIKNQQATSMADVLDNNPAFRSIYPSNDVIMDFSVRGNRVKALDAAYNGMYGLMSPGVESMERIEVITGANALLNGLGPVGGVGGSINLVPKRALDTPLTRITTQYISESQLGVTTDISRRFGQDDRFGIRVNTVYSDGDTPVNDQSKRVTMATMAFDYRGDQLKLTTDFGYRKNDAYVPSRTTYLLGTFNIPSPPSSGKNWQQKWSYDKSEVLTGAIRGEYEITPDLTAYGGLGLSRFREEELFANAFLTGSNGATGARQVYWPLYRNNKTVDAGIRGKSETGPLKHNWSVSASGLWVENGIQATTLATTFSNIYDPIFFDKLSIDGLASAGHVPKTGSTTLSGVAVSDIISVLDDQLQVILGVRHQNILARNYDVTTGALTSQYDKSVTTPGVGVVFKPQNNISLYANYIEGLQQSIAVGGNNTGQNFAPYVSKQYEAGIKVDWGRLATTLSLYQITTPNGSVNPLTNLFAVNGEQRTQGIELNTFGEIVDHVRLLGGIVFVNGKQTKTVNGATDGNQVTGAPHTQMNLGAEWDVPAIEGLTLTARAIYTSSQYADLANLQSIPSWRRYDAGVRYQTHLSNVPTTFRLNVQNLLDKSYWAAAVDGYLVQSMPRTVMLSATFDF